MIFCLKLASNCSGGYLETECSDILKKFYERGNLNLDEEKRHRKKKKPTEEEEEE